MLTETPLRLFLLRNTHLHMNMRNLLANDKIFGTDSFLVSISSQPLGLVTIHM